MAEIVCRFRFNPFQNKPLVFTCLQNKSFENIEGKEENAHNVQFLLFPQCFPPFWITFFHFHQIQNCHLQTLSVWNSLKFVGWERVKVSAYSICRLQKHSHFRF